MILPTTKIQKKIIPKKTEASTFKIPTKNQTELNTKTTKKPISTPANTISQPKRTPVASPDLPAIADIFTSGFMKGVVLFLIVAFNVVLLKNCFLMTISTKQNFSGNTELDAFLYGLAISMLMTIVLFHEENWQNGFCAGAMTLYSNLIILMLYIGFFDGIIGKAGSVWAMSGFVVLLPVIGLFVMVIMLKNR
jgi:hypothetical protein